MGQSNSAPDAKDVPIEQISHELALRFADKCYSHLEIAHFRDNFKNLADHQDTIEYWKEETLCRFLSIPNSLHAGPVIFQMASYLGSFPFPSLAPCILTREAMIKVITILTGRYRKVLKRGDEDKIKLLFRSLAVFDRRMSSNMLSDDQPRIMNTPNLDATEKFNISAQTHPSGFAVDEALNDDEEEDDDDLALAALDALDAIEVFQHDQKKEARLSRAHIPADYLHKLVMLMLLFGPVTPQDNLAAFCEALDEQKRNSLAESADAIIAAFDPDSISNGVQYTKFVKLISVSLPNLFNPLNPLFEHFLFSKNINMSKHKLDAGSPLDAASLQRASVIQSSATNGEVHILNDILLAQLSFSLGISGPASPSSTGLFHSGVRFSEIYSTASHGTSMSSFSKQVLTWKSATLFLISGTSDEDDTYVFGAYLPDRWRDAGESYSGSENIAQAALFQLKPRHSIFHANTHNKSIPLSHFSQKTGISLGCVLPAQSRVQSHYQQPILGPVSLLIDEDISLATFQHDSDAGTGAFCPDPALEQAQRLKQSNVPAKKIAIDIDALEVWGVTFADAAEDEIANQKKRLAWEEAEAARRRGVNFGGDKEGARALLEMAGIVGDGAANRSGGSV